MSSNNQTFALEARVLMCQHCGAPLNVSALGGDTRCEYCDTVNRIAPRPELPVPPSQPPPQPQVPEGVREQQRLGSLHNQAASYNTVSNPYAVYQAPPGLEVLGAEVVRKGFRDTEATQKVQSRFSQAVQACKTSPGDPSVQRQCYWLARVLAQCYNAQDQFLRQRAVLETASEVLEDEGHQYLMRCALSSAARAMGELTAADQWLAQCDPAPALLDLDTQYRTTAACLALVRNQWGKTLALVGPGQGDVPFEPSSRMLSRGIRAAALEGAGNRSAAETELLSTASENGRDDLVRLLEVNDALAPARHSWSRLEARQVIPKGKPKRRGRAKVVGCLFALITLAIIVASLLFSPLVCTGCGSLMGWHQAAMARLRACPTAMVVLGAPVSASSVGFSCGNFETTNGSGSASWRMPVSGSRASGTYHFHAIATNGTWTVRSGRVVVDGRTIDVVNCSGATMVPGGVHMPGGVQVPGGVQRPGGSCDRMAACCQVAGSSGSAQSICGQLQTYRSMPNGDQTCSTALNGLRTLLGATQGSVPPQCQ